MKATRAFTLLEMMITLSVFVLLSAAIFGIITGVLRSASTLQDNQNRGDATVALQAYLKRQLSSLPAQGIVISYRRGDGQGLTQNGIIFGSPVFLTVVDATLQPNGLYQLRLATYTPPASALSTGAPNYQAMATANQLQEIVRGNDSALVWSSLIQDVQKLKWKFQDANSVQWDDIWNNPTTKPNLVELSVEIAGDLQPTVMDFWIPPIVNVPVVISANTNAAPNPHVP